MQTARETTTKIPLRSVNLFGGVKHINKMHRFYEKRRNHFNKLVAAGRYPHNIKTMKQLILHKEKETNTKSGLI
jgi:hypothetical protein